MSLQTKSSFIMDNSFIFMGIAVLIGGLYIGIDYEFNDEVQNALSELKQTEFKIMVSFGESLMVAGYMTMIFGGIGLAILGYSLKRLLK